MGSWQESYSELQKRKDPIFLWNFWKQERSFERFEMSIFPLLILFFCFRQFSTWAQNNLMRALTLWVSGTFWSTFMIENATLTEASEQILIKWKFGSFIYRGESDMYLEG